MEEEDTVAEFQVPSYSTERENQRVEEVNQEESRIQAEIESMDSFPKPKANGGGGGVVVVDPTTIGSLVQKKRKIYDTTSISVGSFCETNAMSSDMVYPSDVTTEMVESLLEKFRKQEMSGLKPIIGGDDPTGIADFTVYHEMENKKFSLHKCILLHHCEYFRGMKRTEMSETKESKITIRQDPELKDYFSSADFELFVHCIYSPEDFTEKLVKYCSFISLPKAPTSNNNSEEKGKGEGEEVEAEEDQSQQQTNDSGFLESTPATPPEIFVPDDSLPGTLWNGSRITCQRCYLLVCSCDGVSKYRPKKEKDLNEEGEKLLLFAVERLLMISEMYGVQLIKEKIKLKILFSLEEDLQWLSSKYPFVIHRLENRYSLFDKEENNMDFIDKFISNCQTIPSYNSKILNKLQQENTATSSSSSSSSSSTSILPACLTVSLLKSLQEENQRFGFDEWIEDLIHTECGGDILKRTFKEIGMIHKFMLKQIKLRHEEPWMRTSFEELMVLVNPEAPFNIVNKHFAWLSTQMQ